MTKKLMPFRFLATAFRRGERTKRMQTNANNCRQDYCSNMSLCLILILLLLLPSQAFGTHKMRKTFKNNNAKQIEPFSVREPDETVDAKYHDCVAVNFSAMLQCQFSVCEKRS